MREHTLIQPHDICPPPLQALRQDARNQINVGNLSSVLHALESSVTLSLSIALPCIFPNYAQLYRISDTASDLCVCEITTNAKRRRWRVEARRGSSIRFQANSGFFIGNNGGIAPGSGVSRLLAPVLSIPRYNGRRKNRGLVRPSQVIMSWTSISQQYCAIKFAPFSFAFVLHLVYFLVVKLVDSTPAGATVDSKALRFLK